MKWLRPTARAVPAASNGVLARAAGVTVRFGDHTVLQSVDFAVQEGEFVALVGPNGAGKSTLFAALTGDIVPAEGVIEVCGEPIHGWSHGDLARQRAVLPQQATVGFPFTVDEIVRMGRAPWAGSLAEESDDEEVGHCLDEMAIADLAPRQFPSLSGGERARVALARVLAQCTKLLLLDEPTAALDLHHQELALRIVRSRVDAGAGAVVVLHDLAQAAAYAHRIVILSEGQVVADGPPQDVLTAELLTAVYHHEIEVVTHPRTGAPLILPVRSP